MKGITTILLSLAIILAFSSNIEAKSPGKSGAGFLKIGVGGKPIAMGSAFCAMVDDPSVIHWNPAGLAFLKNKELSFTHIDWFEDIYYENLTYLLPLQKLGIKIPAVLTSHLGYLGIEDIKEYGPTKDYKGKFKAKNLLFNLSYAQLIKPTISSGFSLKYISEKIKSSSTALAFDIGFLYKTPIKNLNAGLSFQNVRLVSNFKDELPFNIKLGSCYKLLKDDLLTITMDVDLPGDTGGKLYLGAEYIYPEIEDVEIAIRAGYKTGVDVGRLSFGFGVKFDRYKFDYAYSSYEDLGNIHQLSFNLNFDKTPKVDKKAPKSESEKIDSKPPVAIKIKQDNISSPPNFISSDPKPNISFGSEENEKEKEPAFSLANPTSKDISSSSLTTITQPLQAEEEIELEEPELNEYEDTVKEEIDEKLTTKEQLITTVQPSLQAEKEIELMENKKEEVIKKEEKKELTETQLEKGEPLSGKAKVNLWR